MNAVPVIVITMVAFAAVRTKPKGVMTPERRVAFDTAMKECKDPAQLRKLADAFEGCNLIDPWATLLRKRAALRERPKDVRDAHREAFRKGLLCRDPDKVEVLGAAFEEMGATGCAAQLYSIAKGLRGATLVNGDYSFPNGKKRRNRVQRPAPPQMEAPKESVSQVLGSVMMTDKAAVANT